MPPEAPGLEAEIKRLTRRLERERATRLEAEAISEKGLRELYERQKQLELLARIAAASNQMASLRDVLQFAIGQICEYTNWPVGHALLATGASENVQLASSGIWHAPDLDSIAPFRKATQDMVFCSGLGLPGQALNQRKPLWILDVTEEGNFPRHDAAIACGLKGASAFPVFSGSDVVAVLEFFGNDARDPSEHLLDLMSQIGQQLGRVIERQRADEAMRDWTRELMQARDEAKSADVAKSAFLANMSHELRTPLNAVIGFSEMICGEMLGPVGNEKYREYARHVHASGSHLLGLINEILDISKLDAGYVELKDENVDLKAAITACVEVVTPLAEKGAVRLLVDCDPAISHLRADEKRLKQILLNLLSNAVKFTPDNGKVRISAFCRDGSPVIRISDTGIGIAAEDIPRALERFGQVDNSLARKYEGTGLGLPLARKLTELHGGHLDIESEVAHGTSVTLTFPPARLSTPPCAA